MNLGRYSLHNTLDKLTKKKPLTIGYIGGSITKGGGASDNELYSWRALTTRWFRETYPDSPIQEINAALSGTGSDLGAFRCAVELLPYYPDLVFVEFAVNDGGLPQDRSLRGIEGIVRQIHSQNSRTDIVFIYTTAKDHAAISYDQDTLYHTIVNHEKIAKHYGIPSVNVGKALWQEIKQGKGSWESLTPDNTHPSDAGYGIYARIVREFLEEQLKNEVQGKIRKRMPALLIDRPFERTSMIFAQTLEQSGWKEGVQLLENRQFQMIYSNQPGDSLTLKFTGTVIGTYWLVTPDGGDIEWSIDGGEIVTTSSWDHYALEYPLRINYKILDDSLEPGEHILMIRISSQKQPKSEGTWIRLGAFLVGE